MEQLFITYLLKCEVVMPREAVDLAHLVKTTPNTHHSTVNRWIAATIVAVLIAISMHINNSSRSSSTRLPKRNHGDAKTYAKIRNHLSETSNPLVETRPSHQYPIPHS